MAKVTGRASRPAILVLAGLAYIPLLLTKPGRMVTDTKLYLYLNPTRLIADAPYSWDNRQFGGWVPHQTISYLWPQGPWYWFFDKLGVADWIAHRLWVGTLLFVGALGVYWAARLLGMPKSGAFSAAIVYQLSPYILPYVSRTSAMLLPWAALGWLVGLTVLAATSERRWRHPALIALVLATCSAVNATAVLMIAPAPILWLLHAAASRSITWKRAVATAVRTGGLAILVSLWWIVMLRTQSSYGADVLAYSESLQATSLSSTSTETLRGMGYWLFYFGDPYAFATTASRTYLTSSFAIGLSFLLLLVCMTGIALTRWSQRRYAALLILVGTVLAVGVHPIANSSPLMTPLAQNTRSTLALALRSSTRAVPMSTFGLALGAGALVAALGATRIRQRALASGAVVLLAIGNLPALFNGNIIDPGLERDQSPPVAWRQAADDLSHSSSEFRVWQLPGSEFGAFRWGYTVDPPLPGMTTKPLITRDLLPMGSPAVMDLLLALDNRMQDHTLDPAAIAAVARYLAADTIWVANDLAFDRFRTPRPEEAAAIFRDPPRGLGPPVSYGEPTANLSDIPMLDEVAISNPDIGIALAPVQLVPVVDPVSIVRVGARTVVLVGSGDGVVDAAAAGLLRGDEALLYAADVVRDQRARDGRSQPSAIIITDSNRDRARHWGTSQDTVGYTESGGDAHDVLRENERDVRLDVFGPTNAAVDQTIAVLDSGLVVRASGYGEAYAYRPEQRAAMAVDGDPTTAWIVGDRDEPLGHFLTVSDTDGSMRLLQPQGTHATRIISEVRISAAGGFSADVVLGPESLVAPGQLVSVPASTPLTITLIGITQREGTDTGPSGVGFAELGVGTHTEVVRLPLTEVAAEPGTPLAVVLTRERVDPRNRWRSDPEQVLQRQVTLPRAGEFEVTVVLRRNGRASDEVLAALDNTVGATSNRRLTGVPEAAGRFATDGDVTTAWTSAFGTVLGSSLTVPLVDGALSQLTIRQVLDEQHSEITAVRVAIGSTSVDLELPPPDSTGNSVLTLPVPTGGDALTLTVTGISEKVTSDRRYVEDTILPVAITELSAPTIQRTRKVGDHSSRCDASLLTIDGRPLGLQLSVDDLTALAAGDSVRVTTCGAGLLALAEGVHHVASSNGLLHGINVDQVVLDDGVAAATANAQRAPAVAVERTRTSRVATVPACPSGCWLIMGEGWNLGWTATADGHDLGVPLPTAGGFNGWWLPPSGSPTIVTMQWQHQSPVTLALGVSAVSILLCVALAIGRRPRWQPAGSPWHPTPPRLDPTPWERTTRQRSVIAGLALVSFTALAVSPLMAAVGAVVAVAIVWSRRPGAAGIASVLLMAGIAAAVTGRKLLGGTEAGAPGRAKLNGPGLLIITMLAIAVVFERAERDRS